MKSAYELAMERLAAAEGAAKPVSAKLKKQFTELDAKCRAKIAEREILTAQAEAVARRSGEVETIRMLREQLNRERLALEADCEAAKEKLRQAQ